MRLKKALTVIFFNIVLISICYSEVKEVYLKGVQQQKISEGNNFDDLSISFKYESNQVFKKETGLSFSIVLRNKGNKLTILNPLDFLEVNIFDDQGKQVSLPKPPSLRRLNIKDPNYIHKSFSNFNIIKTTINKKNLGNIKKLKNISLEKDDVIEIHFRCNRIKNNKIQRKDINSIIKNADYIRSGTYNVKIILSLLDEYNSRSSYISDSLEIILK